MNRKVMVCFFWIFISIILTFQLLVDDYTPWQAITYSAIITSTFAVYALLLSKHVVKKYIQTKKITFFIQWVLLLSIVASLILTLEDFAIDSFFDGDWNTHRETILAQFFGMWMATILISGIAYAFKLYHHHIETLKSTQKLKDNLNELELRSIRQQLSPHFTFNILNNLQFLIQKDKEEALNLLAQYSKILRYYVYESQNKAIFLNDDVSFLKTYLELEKDRLKGEATLEIDFSIEPNNLNIAPFILSTFVENAFKHLSIKNKWVSVKVSSKSNTLYMRVQNTYNIRKDITTQHTGIGLEQVKKRLQVIYPDKYNLKFHTENDIFSVELNINFD
jgi:two-component system LytT family sensor kinase